MVPILLTVFVLVVVGALAMLALRASNRAKETPVELPPIVIEQPKGRGIQPGDERLQLHLDGDGPDIPTPLPREPRPTKSAACPKCGRPCPVQGKMYYCSVDDYEFTSGGA